MENAHPNFQAQPTTEKEREQRLERASIRFNLAGSFKAQGRYEEALNHYLTVLKTREDILGKDHSDTADTWNAVGDVCYNQEQYERALGFYEKTLKFRIHVLGEQNRRTASTYNKIALCHQRQQNYAKALEFNEHALSIRVATLGEQHKDTAQSYHSAACCHHALGDYTKAVSFYERAIEIRAATLGEQHEDTAHAIFNAASSYLKLSDHTNALKYYKRALSAYEATENISSIVQTCEKISIVYRSLGDRVKEAEFLTRALLASGTTPIKPATERASLLGNENNNDNNDDDMKMEFAGQASSTTFADQVRDVAPAATLEQQPQITVPGSPVATKTLVPVTAATSAATAPPDQPATVPVEELPNPSETEAYDLAAKVSALGVEFDNSEYLERALALQESKAACARGILGENLCRTVGREAEGKALLSECVATLTANRGAQHPDTRKYRDILEKELAK